MKNVESKILQRRSEMMMIGASLTFRPKGDVYIQSPPHFWSQYLHCVFFLSHFLNNFTVRRYALHGLSTAYRTLYAVVS